MLRTPGEVDGLCETRTGGDPVPGYAQISTDLDEEQAAAVQSGWMSGRAESCLWEDEGGGLLVTPLPCSQQSDGKGLRRRALNDSAGQLRSTEEENDVVAKLVHAKNCLKKMNADLQETVDVTEDSNAMLRSENSELRSQIKGMKQAADAAKQLREEAEEMRSSLAELAKAKGTLETSVKQMEKENEMLKSRLETLTNEMSNTSDRQIDKEKIVHLSSLLQDLEGDMEETRLTLEHNQELIQKKDFQIEMLESSQTEYSLIVQDLKEKLKNLEDQLAEALIAGEGSFQGVDGSFSPSTGKRSVSLCEELRLLQHVSEQEPFEVEAEAVGIAAESSTPKLSWWERKWSRLKRGVLSSRLLLPVCVATAVVPLYLDNPSLSSVETILNFAHRLIQPYCSVHHIGLPPI